MIKRFRSLLALGVLAPAALLAQQGTDSTKAATPAVTPLDFSGVLFGNYHYNGGEAAHGSNGFGLDRAYLTFKMPAGDRASIRVTADIFDNGTNGYDYRIKYGYLNYTLWKGSDAKVDGRIGVIHTPVIDPIEQFWPRYISLTPVERAGFMAAADVGAATFTTLPNKMGELYVGVLNGNPTGYKEPTDEDRFKDYTARLLVTPFMSSDAGILKTFAVQGYYYKGTAAGNLVPNTGVDKDKYGVFAGIRDPRLMLGLEWDQRKDGTQVGTTTSFTDSTHNGRVLAAFGQIRPFQMMDSTGLPIGIIARYDQVKPNTDVDGNYAFVVTGLTYDVNKRVQMSLDYQEQTGHNGFTALPSNYAAKSYNLHWNVNF